MWNCRPMTCLVAGLRTVSSDGWGLERGNAIGARPGLTVKDYEGFGLREDQVCQMQDHPPQGAGVRDLREPETQAEAGLRQSVS